MHERLLELENVVEETKKGAADVHAHNKGHVMLGMLELGIIVHSVVIGMDLGASEDGPSTTLGLVLALSFHQLFEGIGLGTCIAGVMQEYPGLVSTQRVVGMITSFAATFPAGVCIGMLLQLLPAFKTHSAAQRWLTGVLDSVSGGILVYLALIHFLAEDFTRTDLNQPEKFVLRWLMVIAVIVGMAVMALLGLWA